MRVEIEGNTQIFGKNYARNLFGFGVKNIPNNGLRLYNNYTTIETFPQLAPSTSITHTIFQWRSSWSAMHEALCLRIYTYYCQQRSWVLYINMYYILFYIRLLYIYYLLYCNLGILFVSRWQQKPPSCALSY